MGLFDQFTHKPDGELYIYIPGEQEAWVGILLACMSADGVVDGLETDAMARMLGLKSKFAGVDIMPYLKSINEAKAKLGGLGLVEACSKSVNVADRDTVFAMAVELVLTDGSLEKEEELVIDTLAKALGLNPEIALKIIEVMLIRTRGNRVV